MVERQLPKLERRVRFPLSAFFIVKKSADYSTLSKQGMRESNSHQRFWRPLSYHLTNPLYSIKMTYKIRHLLSYTLSFKKSIVLLLYCTFKTSYRFPSSFLGQAFDRLVTVSSMHYCTSTSALSTLYSSRGLISLKEGISHLEGGFTLRCLQRLSLPNLATLPCRWSTTDPPVVRPSRSSRTKDSSSQISSARAG